MVGGMGDGRVLGWIVRDSYSPKYNSRVRRICEETTFKDFSFYFPFMGIFPIKWQKTGSLSRASCGGNIPVLASNWRFFTIIM